MYMKYNIWNLNFVRYDIATTTIYCNIACQIQPLFEQIIKLDCHGKK